MLAFQEALQAASAAPEAASSAFHPTLLGWIVLLPFLGFLANGAVAVIAVLRARRAAPRALAGHEHASEAADHAEGNQPHPADIEEHEEHEGPDDHGHAAGPRPWTHVFPSFAAPAFVIAAFLIAVINFFGMAGSHLEEPVVQEFWRWMPVGDLQIPAALMLDQLSMLMVLIITGVGSLIHVFSIGYMKEDPGYPRFMAYLNLFVFFMLILVLGDSYPLMFVGWEGVGLASYLLIGFWFSEKANADAGKKAFIVNRIGDVGFLVAMFMMFANLGTLTFHGVFSAAPTALPFAGPVVTAITLFLFLGAVGKSAQLPLYIWLPDAMAGPTPVSALIHAATMVTAGVYMMVRSSVLFAMAPTSSLVVALVGTLTALFAATIGTKQWDIKKVLAYSTVSQLGFMVAAVGMGAFTAGIFHLMTHAFFKACLFLGSGAVIHAMHEALHATHSEVDAQDMRNMGGLRKFLPITFLAMGVSTLAISGIPPFAGFFSKDEIIGAAWTGASGASPLSGASLWGVSGLTWMGIFGVLLSIAAFLTAYYMGRLMVYTFFGKNRTGEVERRHLHEVEWTMTLPLIVLGVLAVIGGFLNVEGEVPIVGWFDFGQGAALERWLEPVLSGAHSVYAANVPGVAEAGHPAWPILLAIALAVGGLVVAWLVANPDTVGDAAEEPDYTNGLGKLLYHKWYVDEIYHTLVVRPVHFLSRAFSAVVDRGVIDGIVDMLLGRGSVGLGLLVGRIQSGQLNTYAFMIVVGVLAVLGAFLTR